MFGAVLSGQDMVMGADGCLAMPGGGGMSLVSVGELVGIWRGVNHK